MATAYATIASGGYRNRPRVIRKIVTREGKSELPRRWRVHRVKAFEDGVTYEATKILEDNIQGGTGTHAGIGCPAGGKTGTTDHNIDAWFVGFTPKLATAVWVGFPGNALI
jgi:penicillin-binding protein 1A